MGKRTRQPTRRGFFTTKELVSESVSVGKDGLSTMGEGWIEKRLARSLASREFREYLTAKMGGELPTSILRANRSDRASDAAIEGDEGRSYTRTSPIVKALKENAQRGEAQPLLQAAVRGLLPTGAGQQRAIGGALSRFPQNVGRVLVLLLSSPGDLVFDPFAGHNSRMELVAKAGRRYIGYDICKSYVESSQKIWERICEESKAPLLGVEAGGGIPLVKGDVQLFFRSSTKVHLKNDSADFTITSPPYWNVEYYDDHPDQLGLIGTYDEFLDQLGRCANENFRVLKPGCFCVWHANDFVSKNVAYPFHVDVVRLLMNAGFAFWQIAVVDLGASLMSVFSKSIYGKRLLPKQHEYAIIVKKPGTREWTGELEMESEAEVSVPSEQNKKVRSGKAKRALVGVGR